eukprot:TRINITY_DN111613_c0_g1_i1.p2 TRINITY_DN111613_c0_g1~~TRINITY_DN111613_c0_g1_i1.p2  ORF type:complete len:105 (-),score=8.33 TRINITY_DN111613_c0_g1_i1:528-842(-)
MGISDRAQRPRTMKLLAKITLEPQVVLNAVVIIRHDVVTRRTQGVAMKGYAKPADLKIGSAIYVHGIVNNAYIEVASYEDKICLICVPLKRRPAAQKPGLADIC